MRLSANFSLDELTITHHREIANDPSEEVLARLIVTVAGLEQVRSLLAVPIISLSGFRCADLNCIVGGAMTKASLQDLQHSSIYENVRAVARQRVLMFRYSDADSQHMFGEADDFIAPGFGSPLMVCQAIADSNFLFDQLIYEGTWAHISFVADRKPRRSVLTWTGSAYLAGLIEPVH